MNIPSFLVDSSGLTFTKSNDRFGLKGDAKVVDKKKCTKCRCIFPLFRWYSVDFP